MELIDENVWRCADCPVIIHRHPDPDHESERWTRRFISEHEALHTAQLAELGGDREALRMRLNHPGRYAALAQLERITHH